MKVMGPHGAHKLSLEEPEPPLHPSQGAILLEAGDG
jgi:hypothetical protein